MNRVAIGRLLNPGDYYIATRDGKERLTFATEEERDAAHAFMEKVYDEGLRHGRAQLSSVYAAVKESITDHVEACELLLSEMRQVG